MNRDGFRAFLPTVTGLVVAYFVVAAALFASEIARNYWTGVGVSGTILIVYFALVHPRMKSRGGHEYAALIVGVTGGLVFLSSAWMAIAN